MALAALFWGIDQNIALKPDAPPGQQKKITQFDRQATSDCAAAVGFALPEAGTMSIYL